MLAFAQEAVDHRRWIGQQGLAIDNLFWVGIARIESGQISAAAQTLTERLTWLVEQKNRLDIPFALMGWSRILSFRGDGEQATRLLGAAQALLTGSNSTRAPIPPCSSGVRWKPLAQDLRRKCLQRPGQRAR